jgi:hypothetical protein
MTKFTTDWEQPDKNYPAYSKYLIDDNTSIASIWRIPDEVSPEFWEVYLRDDVDISLRDLFNSFETARAFMDEELDKRGYIVIPDKLKVIV